MPRRNPERTGDRGGVGVGNTSGVTKNKLVAVMTLPCKCEVKIYGPMYIFPEYEIVLNPCKEGAVTTTDGRAFQK